MNVSQQESVRVYKMATWSELKAFDRKHDLKGPGLYIVSVDPSPTPLLKVGMSKNLMSRLADYKRNLGGTLKVLGVARVSGAKADYGRNVQLAEKAMLQMIGKDSLFNEREWVKGEHVDDAIKAFSYAHHSFSHRKPEGTAIYLADDIVANRAENRKFIDITKDGQLVRKLPVQADHTYKRLRRVLEGPWRQK
jgi:hypothetical protein